MISILILVLLGAAAAAIIMLLRGSMEHPSNLPELLDRLEPFNAACFRHLASDVDNGYLKQKLPAREYRRLRLLRLSAIRAYYALAFHNSSLLLSYGQVLVRASDADLVEFGQQLSTAAIQLRLALIKGAVGVFCCYFLPVGVPYCRQITEHYDRIGAHLKALCDMHAPDLGITVAEHFSF